MVRRYKLVMCLRLFWLCESGFELVMVAASAGFGFKVVMVV